MSDNDAGVRERLDPCPVCGEAISLVYTGFDVCLSEVAADGICAKRTAEGVVVYLHHEVSEMADTKDTDSDTDD